MKVVVVVFCWYFAFSFFPLMLMMQEIGCSTFNRAATKDYFSDGFFSINGFIFYTIKCLKIVKKIYHSSPNPGPQL